MEFIKYNNIEDFMKENFELILEKEWLNCLMVGNCLEAQKIGIEGWLLAKITQNNKTELIHFRIEPEVKEQSEYIFKILGVNTFTDHPFSIVLLIYHNLYSLDSTRKISKL